VAGGIRPVLPAFAAGAGGTVSSAPGGGQDGGQQGRQRQQGQRSTRHFVLQAKKLTTTPKVPNGMMTVPAPKVKRRIAAARPTSKFGQCLQAPS